MPDLRRIDIERSEGIFEKINDYVERVVRELDPQQVILFGSFAEGDFNEASDIDVVVVADFKESFHDRIKLLMRMNELGIPIEPIGYTKEEFGEMRARRNPFILEVFEKGKTLYSKRPGGT